MPIRKPRRPGFFPALVSALGAAVCLAGCSPAPRASAPPPLNFPVKADIVTDRAGIPHISAGDQRSLFFAMGYAQSRDRLWQMNYWRMLAEGRLSDVMDNSQLQSDGLMLTLGLEARAHRTWDQIGENSPLGRRIVALTAGINQYVTEVNAGKHPLARGFEITHSRPEPWTPVASIEVMYLQGLDLDLDTQQLSRGQWVASHGLTEFWKRWRLSEHDVEYVTAGLASGPASGAVSQAGGRFPGAGPQLAVDLRSLLPAWGPGASNAFAIGGSRTASGKPILANDTHLSHSEPSQWYAVALEVPDTLVAAGFCVPGLPVIVSGRTRRVTWGVTALGANVSPVWAESLDASGHHTLYEGHWEPIREKPLGLRYRLGPIRFPLFWIKARYTRHGPLIQEDKKKHRGYSLGWYAMSDLPVRLRSLAPETALSAADAARQFQDLPTPTLNVIAADMEGRLAYRTCGWIPGYRTAQEPLPLDGTSRASEFPALIPADSMPGSDSPADGYFVNTNNRPAGASYPFQIGDFFMSYRAQRLARLLGDSRHASVDSMTAFQFDALSPQWVRFAPRMLGRLAERSLGPEAAKAREELRAWGGLPDSQAVAPTIFRAWFYCAARRLEANGYDGYLDALLDDRVGAPDSLRGERLAAVLAESFETAVGMLHKKFGAISPAWSWGRAHVAHFVSPLEGRAREFRPDPVWVRGDRYSVNVSGGWTPASAEVTAGPSMRQVSDLSQDSSMRVSLPPGNSEDPRSPHFADHLRTWAAGRWFELRLGAPSASDVESRLKLEYGSGR